MGQSKPSQGVGSIIFTTIIVLSMCIPAVAAGGTTTTTATTEYIVETQDRIDDDGVLGSDENTDNDNVYSSIQAAVDAAPNGALINVTEGTYNETVVVDKPNLVISGNTGDLGAGAAGNAPVLDSGNSRVSAFNITSAANNVVIEGFQVKKYQVTGIWPQVESTQTIESVTLRDNTFSGVYIGVGILSQNDDAVFKGLTVHNNEFSSVAFGVNMQATNGVTDIESTTISENVITGARTDGIQIWAVDGIAEIRGVTISGNTIDDAGKRGIELVAAGDTEDNSVKSVTIRSNTVKSAKLAGIEIETQTGGTVSNIGISHNKLLNNGVGVFHQPEITNGISVKYNVFEGNTDYAIETNSNDLLLAENNWYGATSGPAAPSNSGGSGDAVSENVSYEPFLTRVVSVEDGGASVGNTTTVDVTADAANVAGYEIAVKFNESVLNVTDVKGADFTKPPANIDNENGVVTFTQSQDTGVDKPTLARIEFNVTDAGESDITVANAETGLYDADGEAISSVTFDKGVVVNRTGGNGDVDGDGDVDAGDVVLLQQYIVGDDVNIDTEAADVDGDGDVDAADAQLIQEEIVEN